MSRKKEIDDDLEDLEENIDEEEEEIDDDDVGEIYTCKSCGKDFDITMGDDYLLLCDECAENFDTDRIWSEYDKGNISDEDLKHLDLKQYRN